MADPITIVQVVSASASLAMQCAQVAKGLHDLAGKYKSAEINIRSMANELDILRLAWERIESVMQSWEDSDAIDDSLLAELRLKLDFGRLIVSSLAKDIDAFIKRPFSFLQRTKYVWDKENFRGHQDRVRGQVAAMNLLVSVLNLPTAPARTDMLQKGASVLRQSDESAMSIVPSRLSSRLSSIIASSSQIGLESAELVYQQLAIDDDLFTARVYKRNYRHSLMFFKKNKGLALQTQFLTPSSDSVHTIDSYLPDQSLRQITGPPYEPNLNGSNTFHSTGGEPLQAHYIDTEVSEPKKSVSLPQDRLDWSSVPRAQWSTRGLYWITRGSIDGPAFTPVEDESYFNNIEPYHIKNFVSSIRSEELYDVLALTGNSYRIWRTCLLLEACYQNRDYLVKMLLQHDPTIIDGLWREVPEYGVIATHSPLQLAIDIESPEIVRLLLDKGADHYAVKPRGWAAMKDLWNKGDLKAVEALLLKTSLNVSILFLAADSFQFNMVDVLLEKGLDVDAEYGPLKMGTLLHNFVVHIAEGHCECIRSTENSSEQPCRSVQTVRVLLKHGADPLARGFGGNNIYHLAAKYASSVSHCLEIVLLEAFEKYRSPSLFTRNMDDETPFQVAMNCQNYAIASYFESRGANGEGLGKSTNNDGKIKQALHKYQSSV